VYLIIWEGTNMRKILIRLLLTAPLLSTIANAAETNMRPGLWEISTTSDFLLLAPHLTVDQMESVKDLVKDYGLDFPNIKNGTATAQACLTQEMVNKKTLPNFYQAQLGCNSKDANRNGNNYKADFICDSQTLKGNGTATGTITNPEAFLGQTKFTGKARGNPVSEKADIIGKWVNASCGSVNPL